MLSVLLSAEETPENKKKILQEEYHIAMTVEFEEEVERMCNLSQAVEQRGIEKGIEKGIERGIEKGTMITLNSLVQKGILTKEQAADEAKLTVQEYERIKEELGIVD